MRIAISGMFWTQPNVGSGRYLHELVQALPADQPNDRYILVIPRYTLDKRPQVKGCQVIMMPTPFDGIDENLAKLWFEQVALVQVSRKLRADLIHVPYFAAPRRSKIPVVVTIHDLIPLLLPEYKGSRFVQMYMRLAAVGAKQAAAVIADSEHTRRDIIERLDIPAERITVTHLAAGAPYGPHDEATIQAVCDRLRLRRPYVFYIGGFDARKNVAMVIRAYAEATRGMEEAPHLAIGGKVPSTTSDLFPDIHRVILDAGVASEVSLLGWVTDEDNAALMAGCAAFLFPSRYEGFGLDPLEAMQCGAPVIASNTTSVGEVVGDGGIQVDPDDLAAWSAALRTVLERPAVANDLRRRGIERAKQFRWSTTVQQTLAVYRRVLQG